LELRDEIGEVVPVSGDKASLRLVSAYRKAPKFFLSFSLGTETADIDMRPFGVAGPAICYFSDSTLEYELYRSFLGVAPPFPFPFGREPKLDIGEAWNTEKGVSIAGEIDRSID
jgi:hypothetical protein